MKKRDLINIIIKRLIIYNLKSDIYLLTITKRSLIFLLISRSLIIRKWSSHSNLFLLYAHTVNISEVYSLIFVAIVIVICV